MENILRLVSYNCRGMPRESNTLCNRPSLQLLLNDTENDIICVQERWHTKQDLEQLNNLHPAYHGTGAATIDNIDCLYHGHPREGCPSYRGSNLTGSLHPLSLIWTG